MVNEEMADEEFLEEDFEEAASVSPQPKIRIVPPKKGAPQPQPQPQPQRQPGFGEQQRQENRQQQQQQPQRQPAAVDVQSKAPAEKYAAYTIPNKIGIYDNELGRPLIEDSDMTSVLLALLTKMANDIEEIKGRL